MAKKGLLVLILAAFIVSGVFAIDISAGAGGNIAVYFDSFKLDDTDTEEMRTIGFSAFAFFDATYVEANVGLLFGDLKYGIGGEWSDEAISVSYLIFGVYGKYPIKLAGFTLFPLLGFQLDVGLSMKYEGENVLEGSSLADDMNRFWIKFGAGADFNITDKVYIRPSLLYGINFGSKNYRDAIKAAKDADIKVSSFHHGLDFRVAVGFKF
jgi:opacity protein-like surface antigen